MANEFETLVRREAELSQAMVGLTRELQRNSAGSVSISESQSAAREETDSGTVVDALQAVSRATDGLGSGLGENTKALRDVSAAFGSGLQGLLSDLGGGIGGGGFGSLLKSGFGLAPLALGVARLFDGGRDQEEPVFQSVDSPPALGLTLANTRQGLQELRPADRGAGDSVRTAATPQVVVNVSAMDARGFLDRSDDIAAAVRDAMLRMHSVNDVVEEL